MLPTGHLAAGYLVTKFSLNALLPLFPQADQPKFLIAGAVAAVIADVDVFVSIAKIGKFVSSTKEVDHRKNVFHAPAFHFALAALGFIVGWLGRWSDLQLYAILYFIGFASHFILDSLSYGIMWLWPLKNRLFALHEAGVYHDIPTNSVREFWTKLAVFYFTRAEFYLELLLLALAAYFFLIQIRLI